MSDNCIIWNYNIPTNSYHKYCKNIYSQNGEDGIIIQLLKELNIENGTFCEFGASDGITSSNTFNLIKNYNFSGLAIEGDKTRFKKCLENYKNFPNIKIMNEFVLYNDQNLNLDKLLENGKLDKNFDLLSIDIDCDDYYVWENMNNFTPKIIIFEVNSYRDPIFDELPRKPNIEYEIDLLKEQNSGRIAQGCSFISAVKLGLKKGYIPVSFTGNLIFVRKDLVTNLKEFPYKVSNDPYDYVDLYSNLSLWENTWFTNNILNVNKAIGEYYLKTKEKKIDLNYLKNRVPEILNNINLY